MLCNTTVPAPIKDAASIQLLFFQPYTMVHFRKISSTFIKRNCTKFNKTYLFLTFFKVQILFKSVLNWARYAERIWNKIAITFNEIFAGIEQASEM